MTDRTIKGEIAVDEDKIYKRLLVRNTNPGVPFSIFTYKKTNSASRM